MKSTFRKRVLVTGGAGFLGSHLCERLLNEGHDVPVVIFLRPEMHPYELGLGGKSGQLGRTGAELEQTAEIRRLH